MPESWGGAWTPVRWAGGGQRISDIIYIIYLLCCHGDESDPEPPLAWTNPGLWLCSDPAGGLRRTPGRQQPQWAGLPGGRDQLGRRLRPQEQTGHLHPGHQVPVLDQAADWSLGLFSGFWVLLFLFVVFSVFFLSNLRSWRWNCERPDVVLKWSNQLIEEFLCEDVKYSQGPTAVYTRWDVMEHLVNSWSVNKCMEAHLCHNKN